MIKPRLVFLLALPAFAACRSTDSALDIVGGKLVRSDETLAAHTIALVETGRPFEEYCTAVLIADNAALTAAHCFLRSRKKPALFFGTAIPSSRAKDDQRFVDFREIIIHPNFSEKRIEEFDRQIRKAKSAEGIKAPKEGMDDLAIILFNPPKVDGFGAVPIASGLPTGKTTAAGFGCLSSDCESYSNRLRSVELSLVRELDDTRMLVMDAGKNKGTCAGDSGGPDFMKIENRWELLSIVSTGPESCEAGISIETRVEPYRKWIEGVLEKDRK